MKRLRLAIAVSVLATMQTVGCAGAHERLQAGTLTCNTSVDLGVIVGSQEALNCTFIPSIPGPAQNYTGTITKLGPDFGSTRRGVIVWLVYAATSPKPGDLAGTYLGVTAEATIGAGLGANVLIGGSNKTVALQPVSIEAQVGLNLAAGFAELHLRYVR